MLFMGGYCFELLCVSLQPLLRFRGNKFQKILDPAVQDCADSGKDIDVQPCDLVVAIVIDLGTLHLGTVAEFVFTDSGLADQLIEFDSYGTVIFHAITPLSSNCVGFSIR